MSRPCKCRIISGLPAVTYFKPAGIPLRELDECSISVDGLEAIRLADVEGLSMAEAAARMGVSRHTFGRVLAKAHESVGKALVEGMALRIEGGHYRLVTGSTAEGSLHSEQTERS